MPPVEKCISSRREERVAGSSLPT